MGNVERHDKRNRPGVKLNPDWTKKMRNELGRCSHRETVEMEMIVRSYYSRIFYSTTDTATVE